VDVEAYIEKGVQKKREREAYKAFLRKKKKEP